MDRIKVLIVEDDANMRNLLVAYVRHEGFDAVNAANGAEALKRFDEEKPHVAVLDVMLPVIDGWTVCRRIREASDIPIIMLTARGEEQDKLFGFELGADDYVVKPFSPKELMARIKALLKRANVHGTGHSSGMISYGGLSISPSSRRVFTDGTAIMLTPKEFDLLLHLASHPNQVFSREQLLQDVWGYDYYGEVRTTDTHVKNLREKMGTYGAYISTVWGIGYSFNPDNIGKESENAHE